MSSSDELREFYGHIAVIAQQALQLAEQNSLENDVSQELLKLIEARQELLDKIDALGLELKDLPDGGKEIIKLIKVIQAADSRTQTLLKNQLGSMGNKLSRLRSNQKARKAYLQMEPVNAWFIDRKE